MSQPDQSPSNLRTILFMVGLSFICALVLSLLASALKIPQGEAKALDRSTQMLIAARIINSEGYFQIKDASGQYIPAKFQDEGLVAGSKKDIASSTQILTIFKKRIIPFLIDEQGKMTTFEKEKIDEAEYIDGNRKKGYAQLPFKLAYKILPEEAIKSTDSSRTYDPIGYVIPISGFGLWDAIYGYIAIAPDGNEVIGISWYEQKETPGLGANIAEASWQSQFPGKKIFQPDSSGKTDFSNASLGINVVRGKVVEVLGNSPKANSSVDGMAGATLTGNGVTKAYKDTLGPYRPFFIRLQEQYSKTSNS